MSSQNQTHIIGATTFYLPLLGATFGPYLFDSGPQCVKGMLQTTDGTTLSILPNIGGSGATLGSLGYLLSVIDEPFTWEGPAKFYIGSQSSYSTVQVTLFYHGNDKDAESAKGSTVFSYTPASLFKNNETGVWFDPSDIDLSWRKNLFLYSEQIDNSNWTKTTGTITANSTTAPDNQTTADTLVEAVSSRAEIYQNINVNVNTAYTFSLYVKANPASATRYVGVSSSSIGFGTQAWALFDLATGAKLADNGNVDSFTTQSIGNGWFRVSITDTATSTGNGRFIIYTSNVNNGITSVGGGSVFAWGAQVNVGSTPLTYQRITDGIQDYWNVRSLPIMYQNSTGNIPVSGLEQPVGLILDRSKNYSLGTEIVNLNSLPTPNISNLGGTTGSWNASTRTMSATVGTDSGYPRFQFNFSLVSGTRYRISGRLGGTLTKMNSIRAATSGSTSDLYLDKGSGAFFGVVIASATVLEFILDSTQALPNDISIQELSIKAIDGNHAFQGTAASRPVLSARLNFFNYSEQFDNAVWTKASCTLATTSGPLSSGLAYRVTPTSANWLVYQSVAVGTAKVTMSVWMRSYVGTTQTVDLFVKNGDSVGETLTCSVTSEWTRFVFSSTSTDTAILHGISGKSSAQVDIFGAQFEISSFAMPYQRVGNPTAGTSTTVGVPDYDAANFPIYLRFDGVDDILTQNSTNDLNFGQGSFWAQIAIGNSGNSEYDVIWGKGSNSSANNIRLFISAANVMQVFWGNDGQAYSFAPSTDPFIVKKGSPQLLEWGIDSSSAQVFYANNNNEDRQSITLSGTGSNTVNSNLGADTNSQYPAMMNMYQCIIRKGSLPSSALLLQTRAWVNNKTKAY